MSPAVAPLPDESDLTSANARPGQLDRWGQRALRRGVTLVALLPLLLIVAVKAADLSGDPWLNTYGMGVLLSTIGIFYLAFVRYDDPSEAPPARPDWMPNVTCLVAVKNDEAIIEPCVRSLLEGSYSLVQVIVVDDASTDATPAILDRLAAELPIEVLHLPRNVGKKRALVEGVRRADGEVLVFTDSDCVVAHDAVERCVDALRSNPALGAVSGHARASNAETSLLAAVQDVWYDGQFGVSKAAESSFGSVTCVSGPLAAFRREAVLNYFPAWAADEFLGREFRFATDRQLTAYVLGQQWIGEDLRAAHLDDPLVSDEPYPARSWRVGYVRSARAVTEVPPTFPTFLRQQVRWKKSFVRNLFFTGGFMWRRGLVPALLFYGHAVWVLLGPLMAFRHLVLLPIQGAWLVSGLYACGVVLKGLVWGAAYRVQNPGDRRWVLRPVMSVLSAVVLSWLLLYAVATLRRSTWSRLATTATPAPAEADRSELVAAQP
jgi:cellulose synthase/poly-beta-1,6-N-acetylglucosamine synthase-like glycosyltransferase